MNIVASPIVGGLVQRALFNRTGGMSSLTLLRSQRIVSGKGKPPPFIIIQPGGIAALTCMGISYEELMHEGFLVEDIMISNAHMDSSALVSYRKDGGSSFSALSMRPEALSHIVGSVPMGDAHDTNSVPWGTVLECPGVLLRLVRGDFQKPHRGVVVDMPQANVGAGQVDSGLVLLYAVPKMNILSSHTRACAEGELNVFVARMKARGERLGEAVSNDWFESGNIGYRSCFDGKNIYLGPECLRLHPLTGQHTSHWAQVAVAVAEGIHRDDTIETIARIVDRMNARIFSVHKRMIFFYLQPHTWWRTMYAPYIVALGRSQLLRYRAARQLGLLYDL